MAFTGFIVLRRENGSGAVGGPSPEARSLGLVKVVAPKVRVSETSARWSGTVEDAKVVMVETTGTALEARTNVLAMFPGYATNSVCSISEGNFIES